jgi:hypothetical protein
MGWEKPRLAFSRLNLSTKKNNFATGAIIKWLFLFSKWQQFNPNYGKSILFAAIF